MRAKKRVSAQDHLQGNEGSLGPPKARHDKGGGGKRLHWVNAGLLSANAELSMKTVGIDMLQQLYLKVDGILALKEEQRTALKAFLATGQ